MDRVQKLIAQAGICSRRAAEELIAAGKVTVNGRTIKLGDKAEPTDAVLVNGRRVVPEKQVYILLNKPRHYLSAMSDQFYGKTIAQLLPVQERVYHVGRLDKDARGMIILTNDGGFANKIMHPSNNVTKTYLAQLDRPFTKECRDRVEAGLLLKDGKIKAKVHILAKNYVEITLHEGRHKIVKRIFDHLGLRVLDLKRIRIGKLTLDVNEGRWRQLTQRDRDAIFS
jgi:23S rRNA pseudouridine2605 synthase